MGHDRRTVRADGVTPVDMPSLWFERIVLVEKVGLATGLDQAVRIIHENTGRCVVDLRPVSVVQGFGLRRLTEHPVTKPMPGPSSPKERLVIPE